MIDKSLVTVVVTTVVVAVLGYFLGFPMLFAHTAAEIFWYALLFGGLNVIALSVLWFLNRNEDQKAISEKPATTRKSSTPATAS
jgi:magnesium-transporting ATPase (P-type)